MNQFLLSLLLLTTCLFVSFASPNGSFRTVASTTKSLVDHVTDKIGASSGGASVHLLTAPAAPTISFPNGTTNEDTIAVTLAGGAVTWQYSINAGVDFTAGSGTSFTLPEGTYDINAIQVTDSDELGNESPVSQNDAEIVIDTTAPDAPDVVWPTGTTNDTTVTVTLASDAVTWEYSFDVGVTFTTGTTDLSFDLPEGTYSVGDVRVRNSDAAGNADVLDTSNDAEIVIDTTAPDAPAVTFPSGTSNVGTVTVILDDDAATWEFSIDAGDTFTTGTDTTFELPEATYPIDGIQVRQTDLAGNTGATTKNAAQIVIDTSAPDKPSLAFPQSPSNDGTVTVTLSTSGDSWEYSIDAGVNFTAGTSNTFVLDEGTYAAGVVQVRENDEAGNTSPVSQNDAEIVIDTTPPDAPTVEFPASPNNDGTVQVTLASGSATWEYSIDGSSNWNTGTGMSGDVTFVLPYGTYAVDAIQIRSYDLASNPSAVTKNNYEIEIDEAAPNVDFPTSPNDDGTVTVTVGQNMVSWDYSIDSGNTYVDRTGTSGSFVLAEGTYAIGQVRVRDKDISGVESASVQNPSEIVIDTTAPTVVVSALRNDNDYASGQSSSDSYLELVFTVSESSVNFYTTDISIVCDIDDGYTLTSWTSISSNTYVVRLYPTTGTQFSISVPSNKFTDAAGNGNVVSNTFKWTKTSSSSDDDGLSGGAIAGIVIGVLFGVAGGVFGFMKFRGKGIVVTLKGESSENPMSSL